MRYFAILGAVFAFGSGYAAQAAENVDITGRWEITAEQFGQPAILGPLGDGRFVIAQHDGQYTAAFGAVSFTGAMQTDGLHLACSRASGPCGDLLLKSNGAALNGQGVIAGRPIALTGKRPAVRPYGAPKLYEFEPKAFYPEFSSAIPPVLRIFPGDSVHTRTVDAAGYDEKGKPASPPGNPQTGPFYIEGAMPGDTLAIHFQRVRINRDTAFQGNLVNGNWLDPYYALSLPNMAFAENTWKLDAANGTASLEKPGDKLKQFTVALAPMLGRVGVAPPVNQVISTSFLGPFGGNMDSKEVREGATLYLPVFRPGALLYLGDAHARQGDGELTGQGLETSMDVQFTVDVIEGRTLGQPWVEDDANIVVMGIAGSLDEAFKLATTGMMHWLKDNYGLNPDEAAAILGNDVNYEIAEVVDPDVNVVAKLPKAALSQIPKN